MAVCCPGWIGTIQPGQQSSQDNRQSSKKDNKYQLLYIRLFLLRMGLDTSETCRGWRNILRIHCASSWFFFTQLYRDAGQQNIKFALPRSQEKLLNTILNVFLSSRGDWSRGLLGYDTVQSVFRVRNLKMEAISSSPMLVNYQAARRHNSGTLNTCDSNSHPH